MDISVTPLTMAQATEARRLLDRVLDGANIIMAVESDGGQALLDQLADRLATARCRVFHVTAGLPGSLTLSAFMAQVADRPDLAAHDDEVLDLGFKALTFLDATCDRIVLLVSDAQSLPRGVLRYIQFASKSGSNLQVVFAGKPGFQNLMQANEFMHTRERLAAAPVAAGALARPATAPLAAPSLLSAPRLPESLTAPSLDRVERVRNRLASTPAVSQAQPRNRRLWAGIGLGIVASVALGVGIGEHIAQKTSMAVTEMPSLDAAASSAPSDTGSAALEPPGSPKPAGFNETSPRMLPAASGNTGAAADSASTAAPANDVPNSPAPVIGTDVGRDGAVPSGQPPGNLASGVHPGHPDVPGPQPPTASDDASATAPAAPEALPPAIPVFVRPAVPTPRQAEAGVRDQSPAASESVARRGSAPQPRAAVRSRTGSPRSAPEGETPYAGQSFQWVPPPAEVNPRSQPAGSQPTSPEQPFIGTYTRGPDGVRTFRLNP